MEIKFIYVFFSVPIKNKTEYFNIHTVSEWVRTSDMSKLIIHLQKKENIIHVISPFNSKFRQRISLFYFFFILFVANNIIDIQPQDFSTCTLCTNFSFFSLFCARFFFISCTYVYALCSYITFFFFSCIKQMHDSVKSPFSFERYKIHSH